MEGTGIQASQARGLVRLRLILSTSDPEPVEIGNLFFLALTMASYFPWPEGAVYDPFRLGAFSLLATAGVVLLPLGAYAVLWQPNGILRRILLIALSAGWAFIAGTVALEAGANNTRTLLCVALMLSALWAVYRVAQRP